LLAIDPKRISGATYLKNRGAGKWIAVLYSSQPAVEASQEPVKPGDFPGGLPGIKSMAVLNAEVVLVYATGAAAIC
jgi:hypothetical protein